MTTRDHRPSYYDDDAYESSRGANSSSPYASSQGSRSSYGSSSSSSPYAGRGSSSSPYRQTGSYPPGSGRTYTSSHPTNTTRATGAQGVRHITPNARGDRADASPYGGAAGTDLGTLGRRPITRRNLFIAGAGILAAAAAGFVGCSWYTHRAVACTINDSMRKVPVGSTAADIIALGFASPSAGNLLSLATDEQESKVISGYEGQGNPYTLIVNGTEVDPETWRLSSGDVLTFVDGTDRVEPTTKVETSVPCGIQLADGLLASVGYVAQWGCNGVSTVETGTITGNIVDHGVTTEPQDLIIAKSGINPADGRKLVALTFDDGPDLTYTPQYLDILAQYGARATFFNIGKTLETGGEAYTEMCRRVAEAGHQVASHTYSHNINTLPLLDDETRDYEVSHAFDLVAEASGVATNVFRPPYGEYYATDFLQFLATGGNISYTAYWSIDSDDWEIASQGYTVADGAAQIVSNCTKALYAGYDCNGAVILMHDGGGDRSYDVAALPQIIQAYQAAGYELVTMNEMLAADPTFPEWVYNGYVTRPAGAVIPDTTGYL